VPDALVACHCHGRGLQSSAVISGRGYGGAAADRGLITPPQRGIIPQYFFVLIL
jgi:hypothetical protein